MFSKIFDDTLSLKSQFDKDLENSAKYLSSFILNQSISDIAGSFLSSPGKQIRSILYFKFFNMFKNKNIDLKIKYKTIASIEAVHATTLIHDDIVDNNTKRRGKDSLFKTYGLSKSLLIGDYILVTILKDFFELHDDNFIRRIFLRECHATVYGVVLEELLTKDSSFQESLRVTYLKTSPFFKLSCFLGSYLSSNDFEKSKKAATFGTCFGILFQFQNDLDCYKFDKFEESEDYVQKNMTLPIIILRDYLGYPIDKFLFSTQEGYNEIKSLINSQLFKEAALKLTQKYVDFIENSINN